ncbi:MAG: hypothetical protein AB8G22_05465 [Saprospiraceae bacterium]
MFTERLELLLQTQSFAQLSAADQMFVLQHITEEEYAQMHLLLDTGKAALQDVPKPDAGIESRLQNHLDHVWQTATATPQPTWWQAVFNYKIPLWQTALGAFALLFYFNWQRPVEIIKMAATPEKVYVYQVDTVYEEKKADTIQVKQQMNSDTAIAQFPVQRKRTPRKVNVKPSLDRNVVASDVSREEKTVMESELPAVKSEIEALTNYARGRSAESDSSLFQLIGN